MIISILKISKPVKISWISTILAYCIFIQTTYAAEDIVQLTHQSKLAVKQLGKELKQTLTSTMASEGPNAALKVCNVKAAVITSSVSMSKNVEIRRTSLKPRNKLNSPDEWEQAILLAFQNQKDQGASIASLEHSEVTMLNDQKTFRFMKAIPTQKGCLTCHGDAVKTNLKEKIAEYYPNDTATGFKVGDIRGAFTVKIEL